MDKPEDPDYLSESEEEEEEDDDQIEVEPTTRKEDNLEEEEEEDTIDSSDTESIVDGENPNEDEDTDDELNDNAVSAGAFVDFEDISDDEDNDEEYLQKFDASIQKKLISDFHPELQSHNYDEIDILSRVVRDENGNIIDPLHKTLPFLTRYEKARILGERAKQLNSGAQPFIEIDPTMIDGYLIALQEFDEKKIPFILKRPLPNGGCEYWKFSDLEVLI